jgi:outer membrane protein assembly factor BamA
MSPLLATAPAWADSSYTVSRVVIKGSKSVPTSQLMAVVQEHAGSKVTQADIIADRDAIAKVLSDANVTGSVGVSIETLGHRSEVIFEVTDQGIQAPPPPVVQTVLVYPKLGTESFDGNASVSSALLASASGINPGDEITTPILQAAAQKILAYYGVANPKVTVSLRTTNTPINGGKINILWHITETTPKPKAK